MVKSEFVIEVSDATFEADVLQRSQQTPVVVDFWAPWCGPCRMLGPVLEKLANEFAGGFILAKINTDENQRAAMRYGVQGIPAVKGFKGGQLAAEFVGAVPEPQVRAFLQKLGVQPGSGAGPAGPDPKALLQQGKFAEAEAALRQPGTAGSSLDLVRALLAQGKAEEAGTLIEGIVDGPEAVQAEVLRPLAALVLRAGSAVDDAQGLEGSYIAAGRQAAVGDHRAALESLLGVLRRDKRYRDGEARQAMLAIFAVLGDEHPLVREYRTKLAAVLF